MAGATNKSLRTRIVTGAMWLIGSTALSSALRLAGNLVLVQFLMPSAFGMMAIATIMFIAVEQMSDIGIQQSVVREKDGDTKRFLQAAWTIQLLRSGVVAAGLVLMGVAVAVLAPYLAPADSVYLQPEVPYLIGFIAIAALLAGARSTNLFLANRRLDYAKPALIGLLSQVVSLSAMIGFVLVNPTVWALLLGIIVGAATTTLLSHTVLPGPEMRIRLNKAIFDRLWVFGRWIMLSSFFNFLALRADSLILGGLMGVTAFGVFSIATSLMEAAYSLLRQFSSSLGYPAFSELMRERPHDLQRLFAKYQHTTRLIFVASAIGLFLAAPAFFEILYPPEYFDAGHMLQVMAPAILFLVFLANKQLVVVSGNARIIAACAFVEGLAICSFVPAGFMMYGIDGAIVAAILARNITVPYILYLTKDIVGVSQTYFDAAWLLFSVITLVLMAALF